jgi:hypothetical protein
MTGMLVRRLVCFLILSAVGVAGMWTAVEALAVAAGRGDHLLGLDYRYWWDDTRAADPGGPLRTGLWLACLLLGVILLALGVRRGGRRQTVPIDRSERGDVALRTDGVAQAIRVRLDREPWLSRSRARIRLRGRRVDVTDRPRTSRPWHDDELHAVRSAVAAEATRIGLEAGRIRIEPREPTGNVR